MIVPSIDLMQGRAVQLRRGRDLVLDGGDPLARLEQFAVAGEVAVVDLDAALGKGSNAGLIREMVRRHRAASAVAFATSTRRAPGSMPARHESWSAPRRARISAAPSRAT